MKKLLIITFQFGGLALFPRRAMAHGAGAIPADLWSHWNFAPLLLTILLLLMYLYVRGALGYRMAWWRTTAFMGAVVALFVALISPLDAISASLFSSHMVQHMLLILVAAPLFVWSRPSAPLLRGLPRAWRKGVGNMVHQLALQKMGPAIGAKMGSVMVVFGVHVVALWSWHIPALYNAALADEGVHILEHGCFFVTAALYWWTIFNSDMLRGRVLSAFLMMMASGLLGALMTFATVPWYSSHSLLVGMWGMTPLEDQQLAGLYMWIPAGILYAGVAAALLSVWLNSLEARMLKRERTLGRGVHEGLNNRMSKGLRDA